LGLFSVARKFFLFRRVLSTFIDPETKKT